MREKREAPEPWATWMITAELTARNTKELRASLNRLAEETDTHVSTLSAMIHGERKTSEAKLRAVADALGIDIVTVSAAAGRARTVREPYEPPEQAHSLSREVQDAISDLIRALAKERDQRERDTAANARAGASPVGGKVVIPKKPQRQGASPKR